MKNLSKRTSHVINGLQSCKLLLDGYFRNWPISDLATDAGCVRSWRESRPKRDWSYDGRL